MQRKPPLPSHYHDMELVAEAFDITGLSCTRSSDHGNKKPAQILTIFAPARVRGGARTHFSGDLDR